MINTRFKNKIGFTLTEVLMVLLITGLLISVATPILTKRLVANNHDINVLTCIKKELAFDLNTQACQAAIDNCKFGLNKACTSLGYFAEYGKNSNEKDAARKVLAASCDKGGEEACAYIVDSCKKDSSLCDINGTSNTNDLHNYFIKEISSSTGARIPIIKIAGAYYKANNPNIVNEVNNTCCNPLLTLACRIKGINSCAPPDPECGMTPNTSTIGSIMISNCHNAKNPVAIDGNPGATGCWLGKNTACSGTGCSRPICNHLGAIATCDALNGGVDYGNLNWRLPTSSELATFGTNLVGLDLCDTNASAQPLCRQYAGCTGATNTNCYPYVIWSASPNGSNFIMYLLDVNNNPDWSGPDGNYGGSFAFGVRCVRNIT